MNNVEQGSIITFTDMVVNLQHGMDPQSGRFCAPISGTYSFSFGATSTIEDAATYIRVYKNEEWIFTIAQFTEETTQANYYTNIADNWTFSLKKGDTVHLKMRCNGLYVSVHHNVHFNGQLLIAE